jgi:hypothetical protein
MSKTLKNIKIPYPTEGVIRSFQLDDTVAPENSVQIAVNMHFDRIGAIQTRPGVSTYATTLGGSVQNFGTLSIQGGIKRLYAQVGTDISVWDGALWTSVRTLSTAAYKARFAQFLNYTYMVNGNAGDPVQASNGGAFSAVAGIVPAAFPKGDFISAGFEGRVWVADIATDTLYFSDIVAFTPPSTYILTYTAASNFIKNFSPQNGESITALIRVPRALLVFKQNSIYRVYGSFSTDAYPAYNLGTYSNESVVMATDGFYFHHSSGFYKFNYDGQPTEISRRINDFVIAIPRSYYESIVGVFNGTDAVEWAVGPVTVEGVTFSNCVLRYAISTQVWTVYDYQGEVFKSLIRYDDGTTLNPLVGTASGKVGSLDNGFLDFGQPIYYEFIDRWRSYTEMYSKSKAISGIMVSAENGGGGLLQYQTEKSSPNVWADIDTLNESYDSLFPNASTEDFNIVRLRLRGYSKGEPIIIHGVELLSIQDKGLNQN